MKKLILSLFISSGLFSSGNAQLDTVSIGAGYANTVWYNLDDDTETSVAGNSWDLGFQINGFSGAILANTAYGANLYLYPKGAIADTATLDTNGLSTWTPWHNPSDTWNSGALNNGRTGSATDLGWGTYSVITHHITGDSLFVWVTASGDVKKLWISRLASGKYYFTIANLDGSGKVHRVLDKDDFPGKNFGYYSISQDKNLNLEPNGVWHLVFSKYIEYVPTPYSVSGIRANVNLGLSKAENLADAATFEDVKSLMFTDKINKVGYDWKSYNFATRAYNIEDSTAYFVKMDSLNYWKLEMNGFGGSRNGNYIFKKTKIVLEAAPKDTTSIETFIDEVSTATGFTVFPNPSTDKQITLSLDAIANEALYLNLVSLSGALVHNQNIEASAIQSDIQLNLNHLQSGIYFLSISNESGSSIQKLVLQ
tara:strand:- start:30938 stop:32209 length:1272 start_codon:yes stop_codon:yes gene_type:complete